jgi:DNA-directed RNA polymerase subunit L
MDIKVLEDNGSFLRLEVHGADHTIMGPLADELSRNKKLKLATYSTLHPLLEGFILTVDGGKGVNAKKALETAINGVKGDFKALRDAWKKAR